MNQTEFEGLKAQMGTIITDPFLKQLLTAAFANLYESDNVLRLNNFAYVIRQIFMDQLKNLAPDDKVKGCSWYVPKPKGDYPTVVAQIKYAVHGGIPEKYVADTLKVDTKELCDNIKARIDKLNKLTHINPKSFGISGAKVVSDVKEIAETFIALNEAIRDTREEIYDEIVDILFEAAIDSLTSSTRQELDCLATHYFIEDCSIDEIKILSIDNETMLGKLSGSTEVKLQYGSASDMREDNGAVINESFPFYGDFSAPVSDILKVELDDDTFEVHTDEFYDDIKFQE